VRRIIKILKYDSFHFLMNSMHIFPRLTYSFTNNENRSITDFPANLKFVKIEWITNRYMVRRYKGRSITIVRHCHYKGQLIGANLLYLPTVVNLICFVSCN